MRFTSQEWRGRSEKAPSFRARSIHSNPNLSKILIYDIVILVNKIS